MDLPGQAAADRSLARDWAHDSARELARDFADRLSALQRRGAPGGDEPAAGDVPPAAAAALLPPGPRAHVSGPDAAFEPGPVTALPAGPAVSLGGPAPVVPQGAPASASPPGTDPALQAALSLVRLPDAGSAASRWHFGLAAPGLPVQGLTLTAAPGAALQVQLQAAAALRPQDREHALGQLESLRRRLAERGGPVQGIQWSDHTEAPWSHR